MIKIDLKKANALQHNRSGLIKWIKLFVHCILRSKGQKKWYEIYGIVFDEQIKRYSA